MLSRLARTFFAPRTAARTAFIFKRFYGFEPVVFDLVPHAPQHLDPGDNAASIGANILMRYVAPPGTAIKFFQVVYPMVRGLRNPANQVSVDSLGVFYGLDIHGAPHMALNPNNPQNQSAALHQHAQQIGMTHTFKQDVAAGVAYFIDTPREIIPVGNFPQAPNNVSWWTVVAYNETKHLVHDSYTWGYRAHYNAQNHVVSVEFAHNGPGTVGPKAAVHAGIVRNQFHAQVPAAVLKFYQ